MSELVQINPTRLTWCLRDFGLGSDQFSQELGISHRTMELALKGVPALSFKQLQAVAEFFGRGTLFFLDPVPVQDDLVHTPQFRTIRNKKPQILPDMRKLIERAEWQREVYLGLQEEMGGATSDGEILPVYHGMTPREAGVATRLWLGLQGKLGIDDYRTALEAKGILVFRAQGYPGRWHWGSESPILGFSLYFETYPVIVLRRAAWETQQAFTLIHELGHLILHRAGSIDGAEELYSHEQGEVEANQFAAHLLVPDEALKQVDFAEIPQEPHLYEPWLRGTCLQCGVSTDVVLLRLMEMGRVHPEAYDEYRKWRDQRPEPRTQPGGNRQYRHREPIHILGDRYVRTVLDALEEHQISLPKASSYLDGIKLKDLRALEAYYAGV